MDKLGTFTVSSYLPPSSPLQFNTGGGYEYIRIINNSAYQLSVDLYGSSNASVVPEFYVQDIPTPFSYSGSIKVTPSINITTVSHAQSNSITIEGFYKGELSAPISVPIPQQAVTTTASGKPLYTATFGVNSSVGIVQTLNVFNPPNSGVNFTFHSAKAFSASVTGNVSARIKYLVGGDLNLPTSVAAVSHSGTGTPPVSFAHVTADDSNNSYGNLLVEQYDLQANFTVDLLDFPDNLTLAPGGNLHLDVIDSNSAKLVRVTLKWSEDIAVPPAGGVLTGMAITTVVNQGNPAPTPIVTASPAGDGATATLINNDGTEILGDSLHLGKLTVTGASNPAIDLSAAAILIGLKLKTGSLTGWNVFTGSANNAGTLQAHGLGIKPDFVMFQETGTAGDAGNTFSWDVAASDATNVKVWTGNVTARTYIALAIKL